MTELYGGPVRLIDSPIRFMQARAVAGSPRLYSALTPVVLHAFFVGGTGVIAQSRVTVLAPGLPEPVSPPGFPFPVAAVGAVVFGLIGFTWHAGAVVACDMLTAQSNAPKRWRLVELSALAYWPQLLYSVPALAAMWWLYDPPPMVYRGAGADMMQAAFRYGEQLSREPLQIVLVRAQQFAGIWLVALHAVVLRVVSGLSMGATWAAGIAFALLFLGVPWTVGRAAERLFF